MNYGAGVSISSGQPRDPVDMHDRHPLGTCVPVELYDVLWHRLAGFRLQIERALRDLEDARLLPSPWQCRTGETPEDFLARIWAAYANEAPPSEG